MLEADYQDKTGTLNVLPEAVLTSLNAYRIVLVDGVFAPQWSDTDFGVFELSVAGCHSEFPAPVNGEIFLYLTESLAQTPLMIRVKAGAQAENPCIS